MEVYTSISPLNCNVNKIDENEMNAFTKHWLSRETCSYVRDVNQI